MIEHLGKTSLAIGNIIRNISSIPFIFTMAFATTVNSLTSNLIGAGYQKQISDLCKKVIIMCFLFIVPIILLACVFPRSFLSIYTDNQALIDTAIPTLYVMLFAHLITGPAFIDELCRFGDRKFQSRLIARIGNFSHLHDLYIVCNRLPETKHHNQLDSGIYLRHLLVYRFRIIYVERKMAG